MEELKRCPFCGGEAIEVRASESYWVRCSDCDAEIALCDSRSDAIAAWNRRATQNIGKKECCEQGEEQ
jgi:Lar family restriction alleviation protein